MAEAEKSNWPLFEKKIHLSTQDPFATRSDSRSIKGSERVCSFRVQLDCRVACAPRNDRVQTNPDGRLLVGHALSHGEGLGA